MSKLELLLSKGVERHFDGQKVLFKVESLKEHFEGLLIHESDVEEIEGVGYVKVGDVNFDNATANEIAPKEEFLEEEIETEEPLTETPELETENIPVDEILTVDSEEVKANQIIQGIAPDGIMIDVDALKEEASNESVDSIETVQE